MTELDKLKIQLNINAEDDSKDEALELALEDSTQAILDYTNRNELLPIMNNMVRELAAINYSMQTEEVTSNVTSYKQGDISVNYNSEIPSFIKTRLNRYIKLHACKIIKTRGKK